MFERLFKSPSALARHRNAPYVEERERYLWHCSEQGYTHGTLLMKARELLWVARKLISYPDLRVTLDQLKAVAQNWDEREPNRGKPLNQHWTRKRFIETARPWLRFLGRLVERVEPLPNAHLVEEFASWMDRERSLAATTIKVRYRLIAQFLRWYARQAHPFAEVRLQDIDAFLARCGSEGWSRVSINNMASALRVFFQYAGMKGWCDSRLADAIQGPRLFAQETLPRGPSWDDVKRLFATMDTDRPRDIRDRAIVMLFAIYGLRTSEVARLRLDDIDWELDRMQVRRAKHGGISSYPLVPLVGNAILRYLRCTRPQCPYREVFLTLLPPTRPLSRGGLYSVTSDRMVALEIQTRNRGPHSLRHACATHLMAQGLSLKEIGDHLGHHSTEATRIYAKVDLPHLREVAAFDLGELI